MKHRITLTKKSDPGKFAIPCVVKGVEFPHSMCDTGASVINSVDYGKELGFIGACHCGADYESEYDRALVPLGRNVATELEPKLGRYVATELEPKLGRYIATELFRTSIRHQSMHYRQNLQMLSPEDRSKLSPCFPLF
ncbi:hypothetical protein F2Q68_00040690 [Brassica cretica]|uniref:Uncharacterized protein n=1 Tax=Brassica cretica TaxID=69181 RepID=A0A8S9MJA0_BRACR|nr:hypothetical protein F2Q68_00040690 [Brassica cretica]